MFRFIRNVQIFAGLYLIESIDVTKFNTELCSDLSEMFRFNKNLRNVNLINFNTKNVIDMNAMFDGCSNLERIDNLNKLNTAKLQDVSMMFRDCRELTELNFGDNFDVSSVSSFETNEFNV